MLHKGTDPQLRDLRKYESILAVSGFGIIVFGVWSIIRAGIYYFLNPLDVAVYFSGSDLDQLMASYKEAGLEFFTDHLGSFITGIILTVLATDLLLRIYIGSSALTFARGRKNKVVFIVLVWIMAASALWGIVMTVDDFVEPLIEAFKANSETAFADTGSRGDQAASVSLFVDVTSLLVMVELGISSIKVRRLRKALGIKPYKEIHKEIGDDLNDIIEIGKDIDNIAGDIRNMATDIDIGITDDIESIAGDTE